VEDWETDRCQYCNVRFTLFTRRHHCRWCGKLVCSVCSPKECELRGGHRVRVCVPCYTSLTSITGQQSDALDGLNNRPKEPSAPPPSSYSDYVRAGVREQQRGRLSEGSNGASEDGSHIAWDWGEQLKQQEQRGIRGGNSGNRSPTLESRNNDNCNPPNMNGGFNRRSSSGHWHTREGGDPVTGTLFMKVAEAIQLPGKKEC
jgi:hypothetical protein